MRKTFKLLPYILGMALITMIVSCGKDGPAGPAGSAGPAGPQGPSGPAGPAGATGTANVIYSDWISTTWLPDTVKQGSVVIDTLGWYADISAPKLDTAILNRGEIKTYLNLSTVVTSPFIVPLPYFDGGVLINAYYFPQTVELYSNVQINNGIKVRYVLIPGGTHARSAINWNDYKQVQTYLGLKD
jgi:hypothetical protein